MPIDSSSAPSTPAGVVAISDPTRGVDIVDASAAALIEDGSRMCNLRLTGQATGLRYTSPCRSRLCRRAGVGTTCTQSATHSITNLTVYLLCTDVMLPAGLLSALEWLALKSDLGGRRGVGGGGDL